MLEYVSIQRRKEARPTMHHCALHIGTFDLGAVTHFAPTSRRVKSSVSSESKWLFIKLFFGSKIPAIFDEHWLHYDRFLLERNIIFFCRVWTALDCNVAIKHPDCWSLDFRRNRSHVPSLLWNILAGINNFLIAQEESSCDMKAQGECVVLFYRQISPYRGQNVVLCSALLVRLEPVNILLHYHIHFISIHFNCLSTWKPILWLNIG